MAFTSNKTNNIKCLPSTQRGAGNKFSQKFFQPSEDQLKLHFRRFELKYQLSPSIYNSVKQYVSQRLKLDPFAFHQGSYLVESIYFDSPAFTAYHQSRAGIKNRVKYRLRTYPTHNHSIFWEIKRKQDMTVIKDRSFLSLNQSKQILSGSKIKNKDKTLSSFLFSIRRQLMKPKILVRYRREPFIKHNQDLRITFDSQIETVKVHQTWTKSNSSLTIFPQLIIMEIKFTGSLPFWLAEIIKEFNLERQPFSKYAFSVERLYSHLSWTIS